MNDALGRVLPQYTVLDGTCEDASQTDYFYTLAPAAILPAAAWGISALLPKGGP